MPSSQLSSREGSFDVSGISLDNTGNSDDEDGMDDGEEKDDFLTENDGVSSPTLAAVGTSPTLSSSRLDQEQ